MFPASALRGVLRAIARTAWSAYRLAMRLGLRLAMTVEAGQNRAGHCEHYRRSKREQP